MSRAARASIILFVVIGGYAAFRVLGDEAQFPWPDEWTEAALKLTLWVLPCAYLLWVATGTFREATAALALHPLKVAGYGFGLAASMPMLVAIPFGAAFQPIPLSVIVGTILVGPFAEEVLFRGWLFRQLWLRAQWPPLVAMIVSAMIFGLAHSPNPLQMFTSAAAFSSVSSAAAAGLLFAWIVWRWGSLWPAIGLHTFMNLSWQIFGGPMLATSRTIDSGTTSANAGRIATIAVAILLTLTLKRRKSSTMKPMKEGHGGR